MADTVWIAMQRLGRVSVRPALVARLGGVLLLAVTLAACGDDDDVESTTAPSAPPPTAASSDASPAGSTGATGSPAAATPVSGAGAAAATPGILTDTVGRLADGIAAAWPPVPYRRVQINTPSAGSTPVAGLTAVSTTDEILPPSSVHRTVFGEDGTTVAEFILDGGKLYARGTSIPTIFGTGTGPETWVAFSDEMVQPGTTGGNVLTQLRALFEPRFSGLGEDQRDRVASLVDVVDIDGRTCVVYEAVETTQTGEAINVKIGLTEEGLLCSVTTAGGGLDIVEAFTFGVPVTIDIPTDAATPGAIGATPAAFPSESPVSSTPAP